MKNTIIKSFIASFCFIIGISIFGFIAYKVFAALSNVNSGDTLSATNRNEMISEINTLKTTNTNLQTQINSMKRIDVPTSDTALFDSNCERRWLSSGGIFYANLVRLSNTQLFWTRPDNSSQTYQYLVIKSNDKANCYQYTSTYTFWQGVSKLQKKCQN